MDYHICRSGGCTHAILKPGSDSRSSREGLLGVGTAQGRRDTGWIQAGGKMGARASQVLEPRGGVSAPCRSYGAAPVPGPRR
jgi:hypothetical protein